MSSIIIRNEMNSKIYDRNIPSAQLQPYLDVRPVMTKYSLLPIVDPRKKSNENMVQQPVYNTNAVFNPGNTQSPWSGYASNINTETELRNQIFALQKSDNAVYVPSSTSDLYNYSFNTKKQNENKHSLLFHSEQFNTFDPTPNNLHLGLFNNYTRTQLNTLS
jgi:hypothetical protein